MKLKATLALLTSLCLTAPTPGGSSIPSEITQCSTSDSHYPNIGSYAVSAEIACGTLLGNSNNEGLDLQYGFKRLFVKVPNWAYDGAASDRDMSFEVWTRNKNFPTQTITKDNCKRFFTAERYLDKDRQCWVWNSKGEKVCYIWQLEMAT